MKCSVFIATSVDGFIATRYGGIDWLHTAGNHTADMGENADMGFNDFLASVDCIIMGRKTMDKISGTNLSPDQWPYGDLRIIVLSNSIQTPPANMADKVELYSGDVLILLDQLESEGYIHAYIDGGTTIQEFIRLKQIDTITITMAPVILGEGISLFGALENEIKLFNTQAKAYPNDFIQVKYIVSYR